MTLKNPCKECVVKARCMKRKMRDLVKECYLLEKYLKDVVNRKELTEMKKELTDLYNDLKSSHTL